jgi:lipoyl(octanoyl) transferase
MAIDYIHSNSSLLPYQQTIAKMELYVENIISHKTNEILWFLEHEDVYTAGVSSSYNDILDKDINIIKTGRGGQITYHGPGIRILYLLLDLKKRNLCDLKKYIANLQSVIINSLKHIGVESYILDEHIGVWVKNKNVINGHDKISAIGVRVRKWVSFHGVAINIAPELDKFKKIIPCGIDKKNLGVTSLKELNIDITMEEFDKILKIEFNKIFNV